MTTDADTKRQGPRNRQAIVLAPDRESAEKKFRAKGWSIMRVTHGPPTDAPPHGQPTVILHLQKP